MPIDESKFRMREKARATGARCKEMLDRYVHIRRNGDDLFPKYDILWKRVFIAVAGLIALVVLIVWLCRR